MASLNDLAKKVRNTKNRQSQGFLRTESLNTDGTSYAITTVNKSSGYFQINDEDLSGDADFTQGYEIYVDGSTDNDGAYHVSNVVTGDFDGEGDADDTRIFVRETIENGDANDGTIYTDKDYDYRNVGRIMDSSFNAEPVASDADQDGRESSQLFDVTLSFTMMQTSNEELSLLTDLALPDSEGGRFYANGHYIYFSGTNQVSTADVNAAVVDDPDFRKDGALSFGTGAGELDDPNGMLFENVLFKPSAEIDLSGEASMLPIEFTGRLPLSEVGSLDNDQTITISPS